MAKSIARGLQSLSSYLDMGPGVSDLKDSQIHEEIIKVHVPFIGREQLVNLSTGQGRFNSIHFLALLPCAVYPNKQMLMLGGISILMLTALS